MQQGGSKYGVPPPEMTPFSLEVTGHRPQLVGGISGGQDNISNLPSQPNHQQQQQMAEAVPPINSRPPQPPPTAPNFEELASTVSGNFNDDDALTAGDDTERGPSGNRWPREETLALIKIRSEMDAVFRDATLKGPLWDEVSRKLAEQGYTRSAKKCKEKFENVHKYYKRTKEGRAGRQDGKSYRFFAQLEALNKIGGRSCNATTPPPPTSGAAANPQSSSVIGFNSSGGNRYQPTPLSSMTPLTVTASGGPPELGLSSAPLPASGGGISFSTNSSSTSSSESDGEELAEGVVGRKRKRRSSAGGGGGSKKTMAYIKDLMKKLMDQQEAMQMRFLETIEKREHDRMIRDEAWKREEMTRITREHQAMASERAISATRDAAIIAFLQKITGQTIQLPQPIPISAVSVPEVSVSPPPPQQNTPPPPPPKQQQKAEKLQVVTPVTEGVVVVHDQEGNEMGIGTDPSSSRWPKMEVHALIKLRSEMESRYQDNGPKGPLWEEISAGMKRMGYNRNSKRCKEKWENINKYFKKVKESNKKRPEDAKTCPYFHQLDALYRKKSSSVVVSGGGISSSGNLPTNNNGTSNQEHELPSPRNSNVVRTDVLPISILPPPDPRENQNAEKMVGNGSSSNGDVPANFLGQNLGGTMTLKKPEDTVTEPNTEQQRRQSDVRMDDSDESIDDDNEDDEEEDDEEQKMAYKIEYQIRPTNNVTSVSNGGGTNPSSAAAGSFLAMVQ